MPARALRLLVEVVPGADTGKCPRVDTRWRHGHHRCSDVVGRYPVARAGESGSQNCPVIKSIHMLRGACGAAQLQPPFFAHQRGPRIYEPSCPSSSSSRTTAAGERPAPRVCVVGSRKSANIHVSSEIIWGIPAQFSFFPLPFLLGENRILYKPG